MLQKQVNVNFAAGVPGDPVNTKDVMYTAINPISETNLHVGRFCFYGDGDGSNGTARKVKSGGKAGQIAGFVQRNYTYLGTGVDGGASMTIPSGSTVVVATRGYFYAALEEDSKAGDKIYVAGAGDGKMYVSEEKAQDTENYFDTGWKVIEGGKARETVIIGNL